MFTTIFAAVVTSTSLGSSAIILLVCAGLLGLLHIFKTFHRNPRLVEFAATLPGPPTLPVIGNGFDFFRDGISGVQKMMEYTSKYGLLYRLWLGRHLMLVVSDAEHLPAIFLSSKTLGKPDMCRPFQECFGHGLFSAPVRMWKKHRKTIQPLYGKSNLPFYQSEMNRYICKYLKVLKKHVNGPEFDLWNDMPNMIFDIVTKTIFDIELNSKEEAELQFHKCIQVVDEHIFMSSLRPWLHFKFLRDLRYAFYVNKFRQKLYAFAKKIAEDKMPAVIKNLEQNGNSLEDLSSPSLLSTIYEQSKETGSEQLMLDQIVIISVAATDTTAITLSFLLLVVAIHPDVQNKLYEEIHQVFGDDNRQADIADLDRLPYLDQVLKESQRRFPAIPLIFRHVEEDTRIGSLTVPAETAIAINTIGVHFNPQYYPDPYKFDPDRFSPAEESKRPKLSYIPFSAGVRNCIGLNYAVALVKLAAIAILREYSIHSTTKMEDVKLKVEFITTSLYGYNVSIKRRNQQLNCDFVVE